ncbi:ribonuclease P protein component, partial [Patescibacteria group bacterium]
MKKATARNRKKRQIRAVLQELLSDVVGGYDVVILAQAAIADAESQKIKQDLHDSLKKIGF